MATKDKKGVEELKAGVDFEEIWRRILRWSEAGYEAIPKDELDITKWYGLFYRRPTPGYFMVRVRVTGGILHRGRYSAAQLQTLADITRDFGRDIMDVPSRQQVELRWIRIQDFPEIFRHLREAGLDSRQTGMDNIRGVTTCPVAGLDADEAIDARRLAQEITASFIGEWRYANLPRKFNITAIGCRDDCTHAETNDIGLVPAEKDGRVGFNVRVGGGEGAWGRQSAWVLDAFVNENRATELSLCILDVFSEHGPRGKRGKARLKFLIDDWGIERFREEVAARLSFELETAGEDLTREGGPRDHIGVHPQRDGNHYAGLCVPTGRLMLDQAYELARLAEEYGSAELRLTTAQNVIVPDVPQERVEELLAEPLLAELSPYPAPFTRGLITCTGKDFCPFALAETKGPGRKLARYLDERLGAEVAEITDTFRIHFSGCQNSCARPHAGEIGLHGKGIRRESGEIVDAASVMLGGEQGLGTRFGEPWEKKVPVEELAPKFEALIRRYLAERASEEHFADWCRRAEGLRYT